MYCRVLACDFDGTGAVDGRLAPEAAEALVAARRCGIVTLLVTGRVLEDLQIAKVDLGAFDGVVSENGAVVSLHDGGQRILVGDPPPERLLVALRESGIPFHSGAVVLGTWEQHAADLLGLVRRLGLDQQLVFNRAALMLLPSGVNKAVGIARALDELGRSPRNTIAFGDAENDWSMLVAAEVGVAARGAVPAVWVGADDRLSQSSGEGIATYVRRLLEQDCVSPTPARRHVTLGTSTDGTPATLPASGTNVLISGDPRAGKSWLGGLIAERLLVEGYRLCVIDPEGDHVALNTRPDVLLFGDALALPEPTAIVEVLVAKPLSVVLTLASLSHTQKVDYVGRLIPVLVEARRRSGLPHWTLVDEAHYFLDEGSACVDRLDPRTGSLLLLTYRPSQIAASVYATVGAHVVTHTTVDNERYFVDAILRAADLGDLSAPDALATIEPPLAGLLRPGCTPRWQTFLPRARLTSHVHHARKYIDELLPQGKGFYFQATPVPVLARNVAEFCNAIASVSVESLRRHLLAGDFARWAKDVLGDEPLAAGFRKLEHTARTSGRVSAAELLRHVYDRYAIE